MLSNKNILLRAPELEDATRIMAWENDSQQWIHSQNRLPFSAFEIEQYVLNCHHDLQSEKQYRWMIEHKATQKLLGCVDIFDYDAFNQKAGIGIMIDKAFRQQGYAQQALNLLIDYAFSHLQLHQVYCNVLANNTASIRLFQSLHFKITATKKDWIQHKHEYIDEHVMQRIFTL